MIASPGRRLFLAGLVASGASAALAGGPLTSPMPRLRGTPPASMPAMDLIRNAGLGGRVAYRVVHAETGDTLEEYLPDVRLPPASVAKAATAHYALERLGPDHRFRTRILGTGPVENGSLKGDLILRGGGDPLLDTDTLGAMIAELKAGGLHEVTGTFRIDASALPDIPFIDPEQPDHVGYNPPVGGLNLNFNRVHFEWARTGTGYHVSMQARGARFSPGVDIARMSVADRSLPIYTYEDRDGIDRWTVARAALGKGGSRWLPVKRPAEYAADVFRTLARSHGIVLRPGPDAAGVAGTPLVTHESVPLSRILRDLLRYSTNLTAEAVGLAATMGSGGSPQSLLRSARHMNLWLNRERGTTSCGFVDHSGLGYGARVSPADMVRVLLDARASGALPGLMKEFRTDREGIRVQAKTGTLNFVSALAGFAQAGNGPPLAFAIFTADMPRRDAIDVSERERPQGARGWASRSRTLQKALIGRWAGNASG